VSRVQLLPINSSTLVYGTNDGGYTIHNSNPLMNQLMKKAATNINIKSHICGLRMPSGKVRRGWKVLHSAADVEGHYGTVRLCASSFS